VTETKGWKVKLRYHNANGLNGTEEKNIYLPLTKDLAAIHFKQFDDEFAIIEKRFRQLIEECDEVWIHVEGLKTEESIFGGSFISGESHIYGYGMVEKKGVRYLGEGAKKAIFEMLGGLKKQAKEYCWELARETV